MSTRLELLLLVAFLSAALLGAANVQAQAEDPLARMERELLTPPVYMPATPIPYVSQPRAWLRPPLEYKLSQPLLTPPAAVLPAGSRLTQQEQGTQIARMP